MNTKIMLTGLVVSGMLVACANKDMRRERVNTPSAAAKHLAVDEEASYVTEFSFSKGSAELSGIAKQDLRRVISDAKQTGRIKELKVITWGDSEYPSIRAKKLSPAEVDLVQKRNDAIRDFVKSYSQGTDVETYSMAERPGAIKELFNTSDVRVKRSLEGAGIPNTEMSTNTTPKSSKSIVMVITE